MRKDVEQYCRNNKQFVVCIEKHGKFKGKFVEFVWCLKVVTKPFKTKPDWCRTKVIYKHTDRSKVLKYTTKLLGDYPFLKIN